MRPELLRPRLCEVEYPGFGDAVPEVRMPGESRHRADIDDAARFSFLHLRCKCRDQRGRRFDIDGQDFALVRFGDRAVGIAEQHPGIVDEGMDFPLLDELSYSKEVLQIELDALESFLVATREILVERQNRPTGFQESSCGGQADAPGGAGNEDGG